MFISKKKEIWDHRPENYLPLGLKLFTELGNLVFIEGIRLNAVEC